MKDKALSAKGHKKHAKPKSKGEYGILGASLYGAVAALCLALILILICSAICTLSASASSLITPLSLACTAATYFFAGAMAARKKAAALPCGALSGVMLGAVFFFISLCLDSSLSSSLPLTVSLLLRVSMIALSILGALVSVNARGKKKRRKSKA